MIPSPLHAVIFDLDGLLLDTERVFHRVIFSTCRSLGYEMTDDLHLSLIGNPPEVNEAKLRDRFGSDFPIAAYNDACHSRFELACADGVPLRPGAERLLDVLVARAIPKAIATSSSRAYAETNLGRAGVLHLFEAIVTRTDVSQGKPHPETFLKAAEALGAKPAQCVALEDSFNGVRAASGAGMSTIMVPDFLRPDAAIRALCAGVVESLNVVAVALDGFAPPLRAPGRPDKYESSSSGRLKAEPEDPENARLSASNRRPA